MNITNDIAYIGVDDRKRELFEGQYAVPDGISYNSYLITDDKTVVTDTVDKGFIDEWLDKLEKALKGRKPDYLIVHHMEPDHSAGIMRFARKYPDALLVASAKAFEMMTGFFGTDFSQRRIIVGEGDILSLGRHTLKFITAPMVHWPEVIVSYDEADKTLFSADGFGKFGTLDADGEWTNEARRYYFGIVGKYGPAVQALLKKASALKIEKICPLHGPILTENLGYYLELYDIWSSYGVENDGVMIAYTSIYGNTERAVKILREKLKERGCSEVVTADLARDDMHRAVADAFRLGKLVLATTTYNADVFPFMKSFIEALASRNFQNRTAAFIENGSWTPSAAGCMRAMLEKSKNITFAKNTVTINSSLNKESLLQLEALAQELSAE